jgi:hypothetical protein
VRRHLVARGRCDSISHVDPISAEGGRCLEVATPSRAGSGNMRGVVLACAAAAVAGQLTSCSWSTGGSTFDLSVMQSGTTYVVSDIRDPNSAYFFNFCGVTATPTTNPSTACTTGHPAQNSQPALAWQVENVGTTAPDDQCYRLGGNMTTGWNFTLFGAFARNTRGRGGGGLVGDHSPWLPLPATPHAQTPCTLRRVWC